MKTKALLLTFTLFAAAFGLAPRASAEAEVSFQFFYDTLSPHGEWLQVGDYGDCWRPNGVDDDWSPYTDGYWSYTDAGWTWVSYEDWGGVTYHYGRWVNTDDVGWCWVPDYEWGPAWVSWRHNDNDIGWAPLPPTARWRASVGISTWADDAYDIGPSYYNFCPVVDFGAPLIRSVCYPRSRNVVFISQTINVTNITYNTYNNVIFCGGPSFVFINAHSHHHVPALKLVTNININKTGRAWTNARPVGNTLQVYAPKIVNNNTTIINRPKITKIVNKEKINNGWNIVKDPGEKAKLRDTVKRQNKGLTADNAPAKPVKADDLKVLPVKADPKAPSPVAITNKVRKDRNGDGVPDGPQPGKVANESVPKNPAKDKNGDGVPDNKVGAAEPGHGVKMPGKDRNGDGVPDAPQPGKVANENAPKNPARDKNADGIPDNKVGVAEPGRGVKVPGKDRDKDGNPDVVRPGKVAVDEAPDRPAREQGGFKPPGAGQGQVVPKREREQADVQDAARRQAEMAEKQRRLQEQQSKIERQQQLEREQRKVERPQQGVDQAQRARQMEREAREAQAAKQQRQAERSQQEERMQQAERQQRQADAQRKVYEAQRQQQMQRQQQQQQFQPRQQPVPQQQSIPGGGGQGKGKKQLTPEEAEALRKQRGF